MLGRMELRHSAMPEGGDEPAEDLPAEPEPTELSYRVDRRLTAVRAAGAVIFAVAAVLEGGLLPRLFALLAAAVLAVYALRDLLAPVRLTADADGVTLVTGFVSRRRLAWTEIDRVRLDERRRLGTRSDLLEIDTGEALYLFSSYDLGISCWEAARQLSRLAGA
jgi:PH (Pleckstrin Homology) domain-containing protein